MQIQFLLIHFNMLQHVSLGHQYHPPCRNTYSDVTHMGFEVLKAVLMKIKVF